MIVDFELAPNWILLVRIDIEPNKVLLLFILVAVLIVTITTTFLLFAAFRSLFLLLREAGTHPLPRLPYFTELLEALFIVLFT